MDFDEFFLYEQVRNRLRNNRFDFGVIQCILAAITVILVFLTMNEKAMSGF